MAEAEPVNPFAAPPHVNGPERAMGVLAWVLGAIDTLALLWWIGLGLRIAPAFRDMFADFGAALPLPTRLVIHPAYGLAVATGFTAALVAAALLRIRPGQRAAMLGALLVVHCAAFGATAWALYLPIFQMAANMP